MFINLKYTGYNRHGEQSSAGLFLILMQPTWESTEFPHSEPLCKAFGKDRDAHQTAIPYVMPCPHHGILARLRAKKSDPMVRDEELNAMLDAGEKFKDGCEACQRSKEYQANCFTFSPKPISYPLRAIVRYVRYRQLGHWMMGSVRIGSHRLTLSGSYGSDGLPKSVPDEVYKLGVELPQELYDAWIKGDGWNSAGSEAPLMRKWALSALVAPPGFRIAGNGFACDYKSLPSAQRTFQRLTAQGYTCGVIRDGSRFRVLVERQ